jgi:pyruvate dehydrogenase (quinone)
MDRAPLLAITGQTYHDLLGTNYQQEVDLLSLFKDVAVFNQQVMGPGHVESLIDQACRTAIAHKGVSHITIPVDFQEEKLSKATPSMHMVAGHTSNIAPWRVIPTEDDLRAAADVINRGGRTAILAGQGALGATDELEQLADTLAAPIVKPLLGKACVPDESPYTTGGLGLLGTLPSELAMEECEMLLMVGTRKSAACRSTAIRRALDCDSRSRPAWSATPRRPLRRCCRCSSGVRTARSWKSHRNE